MKSIIVLGCGIAGLSCAVALQDAGFCSIRILARELPPYTTSDVAGGLWFPYKAEPMHRILAWSKVTFQEMMRLRNVPEAGITMTRFFQLFPKQLYRDAWWSGAVEVYRVLTEAEIAAEFPNLPKGQFPSGFYAEVPIAEPHKHLPYLMQRFRARGGTIEHAHIHSLEEVAEPHTIVINCTGLQAKYLVGDDNVFPIRGQIMVVKNTGINRSITIESNDERSEYATYTIARSEDVIMGGVAMENNWETSIDEATIQGIIARCASVEPALAQPIILQHKAGLRPGRTEVRLEAETLSNGATVIHNYGHGGSGYTVNWGCAHEVVHLVRVACSS
ncbi:MAG: FAD-dependent oxidoreductase [Bacteroidota bacterium]|nr:FAD-binding oxidoreductase [Candidatus Kapabacteria bacterium]MDW8219311.1 FAD-dependent oxidoreductase [Bacteroidota bacterium]